MVRNQRDPIKQWEYPKGQLWVPLIMLRIFLNTAGGTLWKTKLIIWTSILNW